jgi:hypothetical protein
VTDRDSTKVKKITWTSTSYNLDADGVTNLALAPIVSGGTQLFENKMNVNFTLDPYAIDNTGNRINTLILIMVVVF